MTYVVETPVAVATVEDLGRLTGVAVPVPLLLVGGLHTRLARQVGLYAGRHCP